MSKKLARKIARRNSKSIEPKLGSFDNASPYRAELNEVFGSSGLPFLYCAVVFSMHVLDSEGMYSDPEVNSSGEARITHACLHAMVALSNGSIEHDALITGAEYLQEKFLGWTVAFGAQAKAHMYDQMPEHEKAEYGWIKHQPTALN